MTDSQVLSQMEMHSAFEMMNSMKIVFRVSLLFLVGRGAPCLVGLFSKFISIAQSSPDIRFDMPEVFVLEIRLGPTENEESGVLRC
jgi:hypothetical protein